MFTDIFSNWFDVPVAVQDAILSFDDSECPYKEHTRILEILKPMGFVYDYGLDGEPYDLERIVD